MDLKSIVPEVTVILTGPNDEKILRNMCEFWHYDFSEILGADLGEDGCFGSRGFDRLRENTERFLIRVDDQLAGFAYVRSDEQGCKLERFFVMRKYRHQGIGKEAVRQLIETRPGQWTLTVRPKNVVALQFWRRILPMLCNKVTEEEERVFEDGVRRIRFCFRVTGGGS